MDNNNPIIVCFYRVNLYKDSGRSLLTFITEVTGMTHNLLTSTVLRVPADSDVIDCALPRCTLSFSKTIQQWRPVRDSNSCTQRERLVS